MSSLGGIFLSVVGFWGIQVFSLVMFFFRDLRGFRFFFYDDFYSFRCLIFICNVFVVFPFDCSCVCVHG